MPTKKLPVEGELIDDAWYLIDGVTIAQYHADDDFLGVPGVGARKVDSSMVRLAAVAVYDPPVDEPGNFGAVVEDGKGVRYVAIAGGPDSPIVRWYESGKGTRVWGELPRPLRVLAEGVPDYKEKTK